MDIDLVFQAYHSNDSYICMIELCTLSAGTYIALTCTHESFLFLSLVCDYCENLKFILLAILEIVLLGCKFPVVLVN